MTSPTMTGLFDLPTELRLAIWDLVCADIKIASPTEPALLRTNRSIRSEALGAYLDTVKSIKQQALDFHQRDISAELSETISDEEIYLYIKQESELRIHYKTLALQQRLAPIDAIITRVQAELDDTGSQ